MLSTTKRHPAWPTASRFCYAETVRFRPFSFIDALPTLWVPSDGCDTLEACALDAACRDAVTRTLTTAEGIAGICCLLPDFRCLGVELADGCGLLYPCNLCL